jgi:hypothetical protein
MLSEEHLGNNIRTKLSVYIILLHVIKNWFHCNASIY